MNKYIEIINHEKHTRLSNVIHDLLINFDNKAATSNNSMNVYWLKVNTNI